MNKQIAGIIVFVITFLNLCIDVILANTSQSETNIYALLFFGLHLFICWVAYRMIKGKRWSAFILAVYYGLSSFNIYTEGFSFYTTTGLNLQISLGDIISINIIELMVFILLIYTLSRKK